MRYNDTKYNEILEKNKAGTVTRDEIHAAMTALQVKMAALKRMNDYMVAALDRPDGPLDRHNKRKKLVYFFCYSCPLWLLTI